MRKQREQQCGRDREKTETTAAAATSAAEETTAAEAAEDTEKNETDEVVIATPRDAVQGSGDAVPVSYTHLTLPTILQV